MGNTYYDLLGLLIEKFGGAESTTIIVELIEDAIRKIKNIRLQNYLPLIVAYCYKEQLNSTIVIPSMTTLLHAMGYSTKGYIQKKQKLIEIGVISGLPHNSFAGDRLLFLDHLIIEFPIIPNLYNEAKILLGQNKLWKSCRPAVAACCALHLIAKKNHIKYQVYILAKYLKIASEAVYAQIKKIENEMDKISLFNTADQIIGESIIN